MKNVRHKVTWDVTVPTGSGNRQIKVWTYGSTKEEAESSFKNICEAMGIEPVSHRISEVEQDSR